MQIVLDLPFPPSTNRLWRVGVRKMYDSIQYTTWRADAAVMFYQQFAKKRPQPLDRFWIYMIIDISRRSSVMDNDNRIKAPLDFCQTAGIVTNDSKSEGVLCEWGHAPSGCRVTLTDYCPWKVVLTGEPPPTNPAQCTTRWRSAGRRAS